MKKKGYKQLVYKSKPGIIPITLRDWVPDKELIIVNEDGSAIMFNIETYRVKKVDATILTNSLA